jgi:hypothetical protein
MVWTTVATAIGGGVIGIAQGIFEKKQETKRLKIKGEQDLQKFEIEQKSTIELAKHNVDIAKYSSITSKNQQEQSEYSDFTSTAVELNKIDAKSGISHLIRPFFSFGFFLLFLTMICYDLFKGGEYYTDNMQYVMISLDFILSYWFVRRGTEKQRLPVFQKKNS